MNLRKLLIGLVGLGLALVLRLPVASAASIIDFDEISAPSTFDAQVPLAEEYASLWSAF